MRNYFEKILGVENVLDNENDLLAYSYDASGLKGKPKIILFPKTIEHLRQIILYANRTKTPITTRGLGTNPLGMTIPNNSIVIDMKRFDKIHTINLREKWVHVDSGVVLSDLQRLLKKYGYRFACLPNSKKVATIGALIAMNQMDRRSHKYGRIKDHVLELELIDGTGKYFEKGNLDFIGMEGVGAIIISAKIKIRLEEEITSTSHETYTEIPDLLASLSEKKKDLTILSLEYVNPLMGELMGLEKKHHLLIEYRGDKGEYQGEKAKKLWYLRDNAWDIASKHNHQYIEDSYCEEESLYDIMFWAEKNNILMVGHIGMGIMHPFFTTNNNESYYELLKNINSSPAGQWGYGLKKKQYVPEAKKKLYLRLKDEYDYNNIINRGLIHEYK